MANYKVIALAVNSMSGRVLHAGEVVKGDVFQDGRAAELVEQGFLEETKEHVTPIGGLAHVTQQEKELDKEGDLTVGAIKHDEEGNPEPAKYSEIVDGADARKEAKKEAAAKKN